MSEPSETSPSIKFVNTVPSLIACLDDLNSALTIPNCISSLYISITPRNASFPSVLILHWTLPRLHGAEVKNPTYLLDISTLAAKALMNMYSSTRSLTMMQFTQDPSLGLVNSNPDSTAYISLQILFESLYITKILFDVRDISHFLFNQCNIALAGVRDLQLMELAVREEGENDMRGLTKCVDLHSPLPHSTKMEWAIAREFVQKSGIPLRGKNPMEPEIMQYYAGEVIMLPGLYKRLREKISPPGQSFWRSEIEICH